MVENISRILQRVKLQYIYWAYQRRKLNALKKKRKIRILFFVINMDMWKNDGLFKLLLQNDRFEPFIMPYLYPNHLFESNFFQQEKMRKEFHKKGFPFVDSFDFEKKKLTNIDDIKPDIIFYAQPYNDGYEGYMPIHLYKKYVIMYIPYCFMMEKKNTFFNLFLQNIAACLFYPTEIHKNIAKEICYNKGVNIKVTGYPMVDVLLSDRKPLGPWKIESNHLKKIIWAPHHSILKSDTLNYSNFLEIAQPMLEFAKNNADKYQFAFKPHPILKDKLYSLAEWGIERTDAYYNAWRDMDNTILCDGEYVDLFLSSDAMIHDSSSFAGEYLYTYKPVMYITKTDHLDYLNSFGKACFDVHYKGINMGDIIAFMDEVVCDGNDYMKNDRIEFIQKSLLPPKNNSVSKNIYMELKNLLSYDN